MHEKLLICLLLVIPYFIPVLSGVSNSSEEVYYYYYDESPPSASELNAQPVKTDEANKAEPKSGDETNYSSTNNGNLQRSSNDDDKGDKGTQTKIVYKQEKESKGAPGNRYEETSSKKSSGKWQPPAASYEEEGVDDDKEPEKVTIERKDPKPKVVVKKEDKPERKVGLLESLACGGDRQKASKCIPILIKPRNEKLPFLSFQLLKKVISGAVDFTEFLACWAELKLCSFESDVSSLFKTCILDIPLLLHGKVDVCLYDIFCGSPNQCKDKYETCMRKTSGEQRWESFKQCTAK